MEVISQTEIQIGIEHGLGNDKRKVRMRVVYPDMSTTGWHDIPDALFTEFLAKAMEVWK